MVINSGKISGMLDGRSASKEEIGLLMTKTDYVDMSEKSDGTSSEKKESGGQDDGE